MTSQFTDDYQFRIDVFRKASLCRHFEKYLFQCIQKKLIKCPCYLSAGQEYIPATLATIFNGTKPALFAQHRCHSWYLSFGGSVEALIDELLGFSTGCAGGMGGSASIHCPDIKMFGHDGLMGSQVPISVGFAYSSQTPSICIMGDASAEEDYALGALGWASTKQLPILFVVEDNNLSILTEKAVRRNWEMQDVCSGFNMEAHAPSDSPLELNNILKEYDFKSPLMINVYTNRLFWHSGAGIDSHDIFDRYQNEMDFLGEEAISIDNHTQSLVESLWLPRLEKL